jgi:hypothetical protein
MYKNSSGFATNQNQIARPIERIGIPRSIIRTLNRFLPKYFRTRIF